MVKYLEPIIKKGKPIRIDGKITKEFEVDKKEFVLDLYSSGE